MKNNNNPFYYYPYHLKYNKAQILKASSFIKEGMKGFTLKKN